MRPFPEARLSGTQVHRWALQWLLGARLLRDHGPLCTAAAVWNILLHAAARLASLLAACREPSAAPSPQAIFRALPDGLPRTLAVLGGRLNDALPGAGVRRLRRRAWPVAIDWRLAPYYGRPQRRRNEVYCSKPRQGATRFHAYATACVVQAGRRYTLALTWVRRHETGAVVLRRLLTRLRQLGLRIKLLLLDRYFFGVPVTALLQELRVPFLMPVADRGRKPRKRRRVTSGLRRLRRQKAGWYRHTLKRGRQEVRVSVCVCYHSNRRRESGRRRRRKLLFAARRVRGAPREIHRRYRTRFGIETSCRQARRARIHTGTRDPRVRLVFAAVALLLRNPWVWVHAEVLTRGGAPGQAAQLGRLRFRQLLDWVARAVAALMHDASTLSRFASLPTCSPKLQRVCRSGAGCAFKVCDIGREDRRAQCSRRSEYLRRAWAGSFLPWGGLLAMGAVSPRPLKPTRRQPGWRAREDTTAIPRSRAAASRRVREASPPAAGRDRLTGAEAPPGVLEQLPALSAGGPP
jgi:Transposase DDE domain